MKIVQLLPTMIYGDAVGNDVTAISGLIREMGYETGIYATNIDKRLSERKDISFIIDMPEMEKEDILIYHASTGDPLNFMISRMRGKKVLRYHNVTPPAFFSGYSGDAESRSEAGYRGVRFLKDYIQYGVSVSDFNRHDLRKLGYRCPIDTCPILIPFSDYDQEPDAQVLKKYQGDGWTNLLFVGRIAPNKKQMDVIRAFQVYQERYNSRSRLFLVGSSSGMEKYEQELKAYIEKEHLTEKVIFPGHIRFREILAYYRLADLFLCLSEHEGFCVPLVEAMYFEKPIIAYDSSAISETLGDAGILLRQKDPGHVADAVNHLLENSAEKEKLLERSRRKLETYRYDAVSRRMSACIEKMCRL